jgi:ligand-binding sensor domain-containing protein/two-component sensor histidine kinase
MRWLFVYIIVSLFCLCARAQLMPFKNYGIRDGLNDNNVQAVIRDDRGLLWVGTDFAVSWFDGKRFYQPQIKTNVGQLYVTGFYKDRSGTVWVLTFFNGIYKYQNGHFINFIVDKKLTNSATNPVTEMLQISVNKYIMLINDGAYLFDGLSFSLFDAGNALLKPNVNAVQQLPDGTILFSTDRGIIQYTYSNGVAKFIGHFLDNSRITKTLVAQKQLWVLSNDGLLAFNTNNPTAFSTPAKTYFKANKIRSITADKGGAIWAFTDNGTMWAPNDTVFKIKDGKTTQYLKRNGLPENIQQLYCDNEGLIWFANRKGVTVLGDEYYEFNAVRNAGINEPVMSLVTDAQNNLWAGTVDGLVRQKNGSYAFYRTINSQQVGYVNWLSKDKSGSFSAATSAGLLNISDGLIKKRFDIPASVIDTDEKKQTWIGGLSGDIWVVNNNVLSKLKIKHFVSEMVVCIHPVNDALWVGYRDLGIVKYKIKKDSLLFDREYSAATGFNDIRIRSSTKDKNGNIVWGTRTNGIFVISGTTGTLVAHLSTKNGLNANWVKGMYCDDAGKLYLATNNGINVVSGGYRSPLVRYIKINDDNINRETNCILNTGPAFYVGTNEGILKWMPAKLHKDSIAPRIYFTKINIPGLKTFAINPYNTISGEVKMSSDEHFISFEFAGVCLKNPENVRYHYLLNGQDNEWGPITEHNDVAYNLKPGDYTFKVAAENADGIWSRQPAIFHFIIRPPFWQTWWFIILMIALSICTVYSLYRYKLSKIIAMEMLRNKISADLHDDIGSTLSSISILSEVAGSETEQKSKRMLVEIKERSLVLMEKMDDIVWSISSKNDTVGDLLLRISQFAATVFEARDIEYEVQVPEAIKDLKLDMQRRQHIYLILKEAINNLIKYSDCTTACITAGYLGGRLNIQISDNGKGFDVKTAPAGNGLNNMKKRTEAMSGFLLIDAKPGSGTKIALSVEIE